MVNTDAVSLRLFLSVLKFETFFKLVSAFTEKQKREVWKSLRRWVRWVRQLHSHSKNLTNPVQSVCGRQKQLLDLYL